NDAARGHEKIFERAHRAAVSQAAGFVRDLLERTVLIARLALFDQITIFQNTASVEKQLNLVSASDDSDLLEVTQRNRVAAERVHAESNVSASDVHDGLLEDRRQLL